MGRRQVGGQANPDAKRLPLSTGNSRRKRWKRPDHCLGAQWPPLILPPRKMGLAGTCWWPQNGLQFQYGVEILVIGRRCGVLIDFRRAVAQHLCKQGLKEGLLNWIRKTHVLNPFKRWAEKLDHRHLRLGFIASFWAVFHSETGLSTIFNTLSLGSFCSDWSRSSSSCDQRNTTLQTRPLPGCCAWINGPAGGVPWGSLQCHVAVGFVCLIFYL